MTQDINDFGFYDQRWLTDNHVHIDGNKKLMLCRICNKVVQINKPLVGPLHICRPTTDPLVAKRLDELGYTYLGGSLKDEKHDTNI